MSHHPGSLLTESDLTTSGVLPPPTVGTRRLVVGIGSAPRITGPLAWVAQQARARGLPVLVVHAWHRPPPLAGTVPLMYDAPGAQPGALAVNALHSLGVDASATTVDDSNANALLTLLEPTDEVVIGIHAGQILRNAFGANTAHGLLRHAPGPVALVPESWTSSQFGIPRVVVGYDATARAGAAITWAIMEAACLGARLEIVQALLPVTPPLPWHHAGDAEGETLRKIRAQAEARGVTDVELVDVNAAEAGSAVALDIASYGAQALVLGNHRAGWLEELTGVSIVERAVRHARCPVIVVPPEME